MYGRSRRLPMVRDCFCTAFRFLFVGHVLLTLAVRTESAATLPVSSSTVTDYLLKYGYLTPQDPKTGALRSEEFVRKAVKAFQKMAGIPQTGEVDAATQKMFDMPRCGNKDNIELGGGARRKRYALQGSKWGKKDLSYKISVYPHGLAAKEVDDEVQKALQVWSDVTPLTFTQRTIGRVDLDVKFVSRSHGDGNPFDGRGRTLAHAFFPQWGGDAHFDDEETWTIAMTSGVNLFQVAAHEFGHSLGLSHSDTSSALMAPFYRGYEEYFKLDEDDIQAVQELYGPSRRTNPTTTPRPSGGNSRGPPVTVPAICQDPSIDAIVMNADEQTYIFKGTSYYRLNNYGIDEGYPRSIANDWELEGPIDCALHWDNGYTFIFKGDYYWKFYNFNLIYKRKISEGFKGVPNDLDAAFVWGGNGKTYFIKGDQYWRYTENNVDSGYPRPLSVWSGLPARIDAAIKWRNGRTYFFSGSEYYRYNDVEFNIDSSYPRKIGNWWLGCPEEAKMGQIRDDTPAASDQNGNDANTGTHHVASDNSDQFLNVDDSTIINALSTDSATNSCIRLGCCGLPFVIIIICNLLQHLLCR